MKSVQLLYPRHSVVNILQRVLRIKHFDVLSVNEEEGTIRAVKKRTFKKDLMVHSRVHMVDNIVTTLNFSIGVKDKYNDNHLIGVDNKEEESLVKSIQHFLLV